MRSDAWGLFGIVFAASGCPSAPPDVSAETSGEAEASTSTTGTSEGSSVATTASTTSSAGETTFAAEDGSTASSASSGDEVCEGTASCAATGSSESTGGSSDSGDPEEPYIYPVLDAGAPTAIMGGPDTVNRARTHFELCPFDDVLVGFVLWARAEGTESTRSGAPMGLAAHCASILMEDGDPEIVLGYDEWLHRRGAGYADDVQHVVDCPAGHVVVGFEGITGVYLRDETQNVVYVDQLSLHCAPLGRDGDAVTLGEPMIVPTTGHAGHPSPAPFGPERCPDGQLARGAVIGAGAWIDSFALWCATPRVAWGGDAPCSDDLQCAFGSCVDERCVERPCLPSSCHCVLFDRRSYAFCHEVPDDDTAEATCRDDAMNLVQLEDGPESGWVHTTAYWFELGPVTLGGTDRAEEGVWTWSDGTVFWSGGPVEGQYAGWTSSQPDNADPGQHCAVLATDGGWTDENCAEFRAFVCEE